MSECLTFEVKSEDSGKRADLFLAEKMPELSRSRVTKLISEGNVFPQVKPSFKVSEGEVYKVTLPEAQPIEAIPQDIPLEILYEDSDVIVINKPKQMVVHPDNTHHEGTVVNALLHHCGDLSGVGGQLRPGIVHRIDMDTTGSVIVCKNDLAHASIAAQLKEHSITRKYLAIALGHFKIKEGTVDAPIARSEKDRKKMAVAKVPSKGKRAVTHYRVLEEYEDYSLVECVLETGRTHQIRVHLSHIHHPILGDEVYGNSGINKKYKDLQGQCLHAYILGFVHPVTGEYIETKAPVPDYFAKLAKGYRF